MRILVSAVPLTSRSLRISEVSDTLDILQAIIFVLQIRKLRLRTGQGPLYLAFDLIASFISLFSKHLLNNDPTSGIILGETGVQR